MAQAGVGDGTAPYPDLRITKVRLCEGLIVAGSIMTLSRGPWVAWAAAALIIFLCRTKKRRRAVVWAAAASIVAAVQSPAPPWLTFRCAGRTPAPVCSRMPPTAMS